jgi:hypothetical protein
MAAILGITVMVNHVHFDSMQGDVAFVRILEEMGCHVEDTREGIRVQGLRDGRLKGVCADMSACSDQAITLAAIAPFAETPTRITGIGHIRFQESNRLHAMATELERMGIRCEEGEDFLVIYPGAPRPCVVQTYEDHRMAMGFALTGLRAEGIVIDNPGCCRKTFEDYFEVLDKTVAQLVRENVIYHGSNMIVATPKILINGRYKDFGYGFYCTNMEIQAKRWALTKKGESIVNRYSYTINPELQICIFETMTEEWLQFVVDCRRGKKHGFDIVEGPMADDQIWDYVEDYVAGNISQAAFWELVKFKYPTHQIVFCTEKALETLSFEGSVKL